MKLAYTIAEAAESTGYSERVITRAIAERSLVARYANTKPVIKADDLTVWLENLPTEKPVK
ncbi:DNA-binding protein [Corynebacterium sp.]|uniref:DNA-binding protein n=1 Tax=Corynebacterium sp. TaxID=1720 RepID=UPI002F409F65